MNWPACCRLLWGLTIGIMLAGASHAEKLALLVGVSSYPALPPDKQLQGPRNDVPLMRELLLRRGFRADRITVLADGVAGAGEPTRARILDAANQLADTAQTGDTVVLYFAGHGAQIATDSAIPPAYRRPYGRQQIFLPRDATPRPAGSPLTRVPNAIIDHELTQVVERLRARGATVWAIFDTCFSGTFVRGETQASTEPSRHLSPQDLGLPELPPLPLGGTAEAASDVVLMDAPARLGRGASDDAGPQPAGGYVAFYAAQQHESTSETLWSAGTAPPMARGLFSRWLTQALESANEATTYRQLGDRIRQSYAAIERRFPTPLFTGTALDAPVFGQSPARALRLWPVSLEGDALRVEAGLLDGLAVGSVLTVLPGPLAPTSTPLGDVKVMSAGLLRATAAWDSDDTRARGTPALKPGTVARLKLAPKTAEAPPPATAQRLLQLAQVCRANELSARLQAQVELRRADQRLALQADAPAVVLDRDQIVVDVRNLDPLVALDLTALYLTSQQRIQALFPRGTSGRIPAAQQATGPARLGFSFHANTKTVGLEHLLLILVRAQSGSEPRDFSRLQRDGLPAPAAPPTPIDCNAVAFITYPLRVQSHTEASAP